MTTVKILEEFTDYYVHEPSGLCCEHLKGDKDCPAKNPDHELKHTQDQNLSTKGSRQPGFHISQKTDMMAK